MLAQLDRAGVRATFYLVGEQVERRPALAAEIAAAGHEIGIHGYRHILLLRRTPGARSATTSHAPADVIGEATGCESLSYRPPYGVFSLAGLRLARERWAPLLWSHWGRDWEAKATPSSIAARATRGPRPRAPWCCSTTATRTAPPRSWRQTSRGAAGGARRGARRAGEPLVTVSQST